MPHAIEAIHDDGSLPFQSLRAHQLALSHMRCATSPNTLNVIQWLRLESIAVFLQPQELQIFCGVSQPSPRHQRPPIPSIPHFQRNFIGTVVPTLELPKRYARNVLWSLKNNSEER